MIRDFNVRHSHVFGAFLVYMGVHYYNLNQAIKKFGKENIVQYGLAAYVIRVDAEHCKRTNE